MFKETKLKTYMKRTGCLLIALVLFLACFAPLAFAGNDGQKKLIYGIVAGSVIGAALIAYWIYILIREHRFASRSGQGKNESK